MEEKRISEGTARGIRCGRAHGGKDKGEATERVESGGGAFYERVYAVVRRIPYGRVASYGQIARMIGAPRAARQVGWAMRRCPDDLPWQRVVMADGSITGGSYAELRRAKLEAEGVKFTPDGRADMRACRWNGRDAAEESAEG